MKGRHGETILITDQDRPVARLIPVSAENGQTSSDELALLERKGIPRRGLPFGTARLAAEHAKAR